jgi:AcrR family transcriptional regulator
MGRQGQASRLQKRSRRTRARRTRGAILDAARDCFSRSGLADTTVADIAARAGLSPAALYVHFRNKRQLFDSLRRPDLDRPAEGPLRRRGEIIKAAQRVFSEKGLAQATLDEIASAVGITRAALYNYFKSKEELIASVLTYLPIGDALNSIWGASAGCRADPAKTLHELALVFLRLFQDPTRLALIRIMLSEGPRDSKIAAAFRQEMVARSATLLARHFDRMGFGPKRDLPYYAAAFAGMLFHWVIFHRVLAVPPCSSLGSGKMPLDHCHDTEEAMALRTVRLFLYGMERGRPRGQPRRDKGDVEKQTPFPPEGGCI